MRTAACKESEERREEEEEESRFGVLFAFSSSKEDEREAGKEDIVDERNDGKVDGKEEWMRK